MPTLLNNLYQNTYAYKNTDFVNDVNEECRKFLSEFSISLLSYFESTMHSNMQSVFDSFMSSPFYNDQSIDFIKDYHKNSGKEYSDRFSTSVINKYYGQIAKSISNYDPWFDTSIENIASCIENGTIKFARYNPYKSGSYFSNEWFQNKFKECIATVEYEGERKHISGTSHASYSLIVDFMIDCMLDSTTTHSRIHMFSLMRKKFLVIYNPKLICSDDENTNNIFVSDLKFSKEHVLSDAYLKEFVSNSLQNKDLNHKRFASKILKIQLFKDYIHSRVVAKKELENANKDDIKTELDKLKSYNNMKDIYTW